MKRSVFIIRYRGAYSVRPVKKSCSLSVVQTERNFNKDMYRVIILSDNYCCQFMSAHLL